MFRAHYECQREHLLSGLCAQVTLASLIGPAKQLVSLACHNKLSPSRDINGFKQYPCQCMFCLPPLINPLAYAPPQMPRIILHQTNTCNPSAFMSGPDRWQRPVLTLSECPYDRWMIRRKHKSCQSGTEQTDKVRWFQAT
jgi:hypothetical protein